MEILVNEPKTKRGKATFDKICDSADILFFEKGYYDTTINEITNSADVGTGTFYIYFNDKISVYKFLLTRYSHEIRSVVKEATKDSKGRLQEEKDGIKAFLEYIKEKPRAYNIIWNSLYIDKQSFKDYYENFAEKYAKGIRAGQISNEVVEGDVVLISYFLMGVVNFIGLKYVLFDEKENFDEIVDKVIDLLETGMFR